MKRTKALRAKTPLRAKTTLRRTKSRKTPKKRSERKSSPPKGYQTPTWFNKIKLTYSEHGNTVEQKRLWRVVTDTYRQEEWEAYGPYCPICSTPLPHWKDGQMLHWLRYSSCNSWLKWERKNLIFGCAGCNRLDDAITQWKMSEILKFRYGEDILLWIQQENLRLQKEKIKIEPWMIVDYVARLRPDLVE